VLKTFWIILLGYCLLSGCRFEGSFKNYCFILQIDMHHWHRAVLNLVFLSSGSATVSASATAAFPLVAAAAAAIICLDDIPASGPRRSRDDCLQLHE
jgi:hypothetical protein